MVRPNSTISNRLRRFVQKCDLLDRIVRRIYRQYIIKYSQTITWLAHGRKFDASINPMKITYINPQIVVGKQQEKSKFTFSDVISEVRDGDWDRNYVPIEEHWMYVSFQDHFEKGVKWEETEFYQHCVREINNDEIKWGCASISEFEDRLEKIDFLFDKIQNEGYQLQSELMETDDEIKRDIHNYWPPELKEVCVNISREGDIILHDGRHRFFIAKIAGIERIPVRIKARHLQWQKLRDQCLHHGNNQTKHQDLENLV